MARTCAARSPRASRWRESSARRSSPTNDALMHAPERRPLADVLACIREKTTLDGRRAPDPGQCRAASEKPATKWRGCSPRRRQAVAETIRFLDGLAFSLDELAHRYPEELREGYATPQAALAAFALEGAARALSRRRAGADARGARP